MNYLDKMESEVKYYCKAFPVVFSKAKMAKLYDVEGKEYLDFFAGAGAINYGHNNEFIMNSIVDYIGNNGVIHALDMYTTAKEAFVRKFTESILIPKGLDYKLMFCGPTGTNSVEAALKLARKVKKRQNIFSFMGGFHGMSLGSLSVTSNESSRKGAGVPLENVTFMPFPYGFNSSFDTIEYMQNVLNDDHSGISKPAAVILETVQAEGGVVVADIEWLRRLRKLCDEQDILLICDEIQVGCGRTGTFFSFERAGIIPDLVTVAKSISGSGLPMSLLLFKKELDQWKPGEHNGTFRGNQLAFVGATAALEYLEDKDLLAETRRKGEIVSNFIHERILPIDAKLQHRGIGLIQGIEFAYTDIEDASGLVARECFKQNLIIERAGREDSVLKILPPLVITDEELYQGLTVIEAAIKKVFLC
jgi:diaminobutyrate-2-oxoglutarate transaminase